MVQDMLVLSAKVSSEYVICRVLFETKNQFYKNISFNFAV